MKAAPKDAKKTATGIAYKLVTKGKGTKHPSATDRVTVHYAGWTPDGKQFDSSIPRGEPTSFPLERRDQGLDRRRAAHGRGRQDELLDPVGARLRRPARTAGCARGPLVFEIELISITPGATR